MKRAAAAEYRDFGFCLRIGERTTPLSICMAAGLISDPRPVMGTWSARLPREQRQGHLFPITVLHPNIRFRPQRMMCWHAIADFRRRVFQGPLSRVTPLAAISRWGLPLALQTTRLVARQRLSALRCF